MSDLTPIVPVPKGRRLPDFSDRQYQFRGLETVFEYWIGDDLGFYVLRYYPQDRGKKRFFRYCCTAEQGWEFCEPPEPFPIYNLRELLSRPDDDAIAVEGEKNVEIAKAAFPEFVFFTTMNGVEGIHHADLEPLRGRKGKVFASHDTGDKGLRYQRNLCRRLKDLGIVAQVIDFNRVLGRTERDNYDIADEIEAAGGDTDKLASLRNALVQCSTPFSGLGMKEWHDKRGPQPSYNAKNYAIVADMLKFADVSYASSLTFYGKIIHQLNWAEKGKELWLSLSASLDDDAARIGAPYQWAKWDKKGTGPRLHIDMLAGIAISNGWCPPSYRSFSSYRMTPRKGLEFVSGTRKTIPKEPDAETEETIAAAEAVAPIDIEAWVADLTINLTDSKRVGEAADTLVQMMLDQLKSPAERKVLIKAFARKTELSVAPIEEMVREAQSKRKLKADTELTKGLSAEDGEGDKTTWICAPFEILSLAHSPSNSSWGLVLRWRDHNKVTKTFPVFPEQINAPSGKLATLLGNEGLSINFFGWAHLSAYLTGALSDIVVPNRSLVIHRPGWHRIEGVWIFNLHDQTFVPKNRPVDPNAVILSGIVSSKYKAKGTLQEWRENVAIHAVNNPLLLMWMSAGFSSFLLRRLGRSGFTNHGYKDSSGGKTTAERLAASALGDPDQVVISWKTTANGAERTFQLHSDIGVFLDESGLIHSGKDIEDVIFMLSSGIGKVRMNTDLNLRKVAEFCLCALSTGESSIVKKIGEDGTTRRKSGHDVRVLEVEFDAGEGSGVFSVVPSGFTPRTYTDHIVEQTRRFHGTAAPAFIQTLLEMSDEELQVSFAKIIKDLEIKDEWSAQFQRIISSMVAVNTLAGELALAAGILAGEKGDAVLAAKWLIERLIEARGEAAVTTSGEEQRVLSDIRLVLSKHEKNRFPSAHVVEKARTQYFPDSDPDIPPEEGKEKGGSVLLVIDPAKSEGEQWGWRRTEKGQQEFCWKPEIWQRFLDDKGYDHRIINKLIYRLGYFGAVEMKGDKVHQYSVPTYIQVEGKSFRLYRISARILDSVGVGSLAVIQGGKGD